MSARAIGGGSAQPLPTGASLRLLIASTSSASAIQFTRKGVTYNVDSGQTFKILKMYISMLGQTDISIGWGTTNTTTMSNIIISSVIFPTSGLSMTIPFEEQDFTTILSSSLISGHSTASTTWTCWMLGYVS